MYRPLFYIGVVSNSVTVYDFIDSEFKFLIVVPGVHIFLSRRATVVIYN